VWIGFIWLKAEISDELVRKAMNLQVTVIWDFLGYLNVSFIKSHLFHGVSFLF